MGRRNLTCSEERKILIRSVMDVGGFWDWYPTSSLEKVLKHHGQGGMSSWIIDVETDKPIYRWHRGRQAWIKIA